MNCVRFNWKSFTVSIIWWQCTIFECCSCSSAFWISTEKLAINISKYIHCLVRYGSIIFGKRWETSRKWYQKLNGNAIVMRTPEGIRTNLIIELIIYLSICIESNTISFRYLTFFPAKFKPHELWTSRILLKFHVRNLKTQRLTTSK